MLKIIFYFLGTLLHGFGILVGGCNVIVECLLQKKDLSVKQDCHHLYVTGNVTDL